MKFNGDKFEFITFSIKVSKDKTKSCISPDGNVIKERDDVRSWQFSYPEVWNSLTKYENGDRYTWILLLSKIYSKC